MVAIACYNVSKAYGDHWAVRNLDLSVPTGAIFALVGPNGAGKSSTIKMLATLLEPSAGRVMIDGFDTFSDRAQVRARIGYLPDHFTLYEDMTVERCLDFYGSCFNLSKAKRTARIGRLLELLNLTSKRQAIIRDLSRGMKQRVGIARALLHSPPVLLLDEPASGLDPASRVALRGLLLRLRDEEAMTILVSSHILTELNSFCDSIAILQQGRLLETGRIEDIQARLGGGRALYTLTFHKGLNMAEERLSVVHGIEGVERHGNTLKFLYSATDGQAGELLADLVQHGARVIGMDRGSNDMEWIYTAISNDRVA